MDARTPDTDVALSENAVFRVTGMDCGACVTKIETAVRRLPGVSVADASLAQGRLTVAHDGTADMERVARQVRNLGYRIAPARDGDDASAPDAAETVWWRAPKARLTAGYAGLLAIAIGVGAVLPDIGQMAMLAALLVGLVPIARRAFAAAGAGTPFSIEMLMTIAAAGAAVIGATGEAATVVLLFLIGELLEGVAAGRARNSIRALSRLLPDTALIEGPDGATRMPVGVLEVGMTIVVRPGDRIGADGVVADGASDVDEASVTGESEPVPKAKGDAVFAGTVNANGTLRVRVSAPTGDNTISRIVRLVEEAQAAKSPTERYIDRFSRVYTPAVLAIAALTAVLPPLAFGGSWNEWIYKALALLLIGCPCALVISTPAAIAAGLSAGARRGLLMKGGAVLERLRDVTVVAFDKTGTLTEGRPEVTAVVALSRSRADVLSLAAALEQSSSHPLATAIVASARIEKAPIPPAFDAQAVPGKGVHGSVGREPVFVGSPAAACGHADLKAAAAEIDRLVETGSTVVVVVASGTVAGLVAVRDAPRTDAAAAIREIRARGLRTLMLTGDTGRVARAVSEQLGLEARAELLPEDKQRVVRALQADGAVVAKVGDGINDAPALAAADVGIAMGSGTDVALDTADAAILNGRVRDVLGLIDLSASTMGTIRQNIAVALGLKALFLVTTLAGITGLWPAILADTGATVLVTANAMRLLGWRQRAAAEAGPVG